MTMPCSPKGKEKADGSLFSGFHTPQAKHGAMAMDIETEAQGMNESSNSNNPWVEKYRPTALNDVVHHGDIIATRKQRSLCLI